MRFLFSFALFWIALCHEAYAVDPTLSGTYTAVRAYAGHVITFTSGRFTMNYLSDVA